MTPEQRQKLFNLMQGEHNLSLLESDMDEIARIFESSPTEPEAQKELTEDELQALSSVGIIAKNWYAVTYNENQVPFAMFNNEEYAKVYRDQFCATAVIVPYPMQIKDYRKQQNQPQPEVDKCPNCGNKKQDRKPTWCMNVFHLFNDKPPSKEDLAFVASYNRDNVHYIEPQPEKVDDVQWQDIMTTAAGIESQEEQSELWDFYDTEKYMDELIRRFNEGGTIWVIERTDTNEFYYPPMSPYIHTFGKGYSERQCQWHKEISLFVATSGFLSKADADKYSWHRDGFEQGCSNCGHGGVPIQITEHQFLNPASTMTKTYEECLEIISRRDYNRDWKDTYLLEGYPTIVQKMKEAALLYGESKFEEGKQYIIGLTEHQTNL